MGDSGRSLDNRLSTSIFFWLSLPPGQNLAMFVFLYWRAQFLWGDPLLQHSSLLIIAPSSCPFGSSSGKAVASSWVLYHPSLLSFSHAHLFNQCLCSTFSNYPSWVLLPGPWPRQSLCPLHREIIPRLYCSQYSTPGPNSEKSSIRSHLFSSPKTILHWQAGTPQESSTSLYHHSTLSSHISLNVFLSKRARLCINHLSTRVLIREPNIYINTLPRLLFHARITPHFI